MKPDIANASRETRRYVSAYRQHQGDDKKRRMVEAALELIDEGRLRPTARAIVERVGCSPCNLVHHFGSIDGLYEQLAADHAAAIAKAAGLFLIVHPDDQPYVVKLILFGRRPEAGT